MKKINIINTDNISKTHYEISGEIQNNVNFPIHKELSIPYHNGFQEPFKMRQYKPRK